ncbi:putative Leucine-rich receptor-like kinase family protein [Melia azedarach]|uniref:Leucine-rich receptor-like kinase family protein n=1 Tax=Melia azedarach TaxID=155640 RepID=A0ACC1Y4E8_MELAZ|nr:putative Leucine-rich receptor-like kinase family protein [Melia azedarach]
MSSKLFLLWFFVILFQLEAGVADSNTIRCIEEEREALLELKQSLVDESGFLYSWGIEDEKRDCCRWRGVRCSNYTGNVIVLNLKASYDSPNEPLKGTISPALLKLHHLRKLDLSSNDFSGSPIPEFIGSLSKLRYLNLLAAGFAGPIPPQIGNLTRLKYLDLSFNNLFSVGSLEWLFHLSLLSSSLQNIDISRNNLTTASIYPWLFNISSNLNDLALSFNLLQGSIPDAFRQMMSLRSLSLSGNEFEDGIPKFFANMCSVDFFDISFNKFEGQLSEYIQNLSCGCIKNSLEQLYLDHNQITGSMPHLSRFSSLTDLSLSQNRLNGTIVNSIGQLLNLQHLDLRENSLEGVISEALFSNLSNLWYLQLGGNSLILDFSHDWVPSFQLNIVDLSSCKMGPHFPNWLRTQSKILELDISNAGISDTVPDWFWDILPGLVDLNISHNQIRGKLPNLSLRFDSYRGPGIDISSNHFEGPVPPLPSNASYLNLAKNNFSGSISFLCSISGHKLVYLDLSSNLLSGNLPDCWMQLDSLAILILANNSFSGKIPDSISFLHNIETLSLYDNSLTGELPLFLKNFSRLKNMDFGRNELSGEISAWMGESLPNLVILSLQSNKFHGSVPFQLCHLAHVQILDLSLNSLSGTIPKCFKNFTAMAQERSSNPTITFHYKTDLQSHSYSDNAVLTWKGNRYEYKTTLGLVKSLDLSSNQFSGAFPEEIMDLVGLIALNLSRNNLTGHISPKIGQLNSLDFLDLSRNKFFGEIPTSLSQLNRLSVMDLSYNNLSGKIPSGTQLQSFNASVYAGNRELCGLPLPNKCPGEEPTPGPVITRGAEDASIPEEEDQIITLGFYVSLIVGFIAAFWVVCGTLMLNSSWRYAYFSFLIGIKDWFYVKAAVNIAKLKRRLRS